MNYAGHEVLQFAYYFLPEKFYTANKSSCVHVLPSLSAKKNYIFYSHLYHLDEVYIMSTDNILWEESNNFLNSEILKET
jgi:hypothetical protein